MSHASKGVLTCVHIHSIGLDCEHLPLFPIFLAMILMPKCTRTQQTMEVR
jgi:hypothetical protein